MPTEHEAADLIASLTGQRPTEIRPLGGACAARLPDGGTVFAKSVSNTMPTATAAEAASLRWLAEPEVVPIPRVHGYTERWLVIDHIDTEAPTPRAAEEFGRGLARLHAAGAPAHGCPPPDGPADAWIGLAPMRNEPSERWTEFYVEHRVRPYLRQARDSGALSPAQATVIDTVCERIDDLAGPEEPPARLHGDLWSGNVHWSKRVWLIDPAAHGGRRETDLAMLHLFGCPYLERIIAAYHESHPLADGWRDRIGLHQLFPLLVHTVLFGGGYAAQSAAAARSALRQA